MSREIYTEWTCDRCGHVERAEFTEGAVSLRPDGWYYFAAKDDYEDDFHLCPDCDKAFDEFMGWDKE